MPNYNHMKNVALISILAIAMLAFLAQERMDLGKTGRISASGVYDIFLCGNDPKCMDGITESLLEKKSAIDLLAELDNLGKEKSEILIQCHPIAHSIGRMLYKKLSEDDKHLGDVFQECDHTCHSGCFHGSMERVFFSDEPVGTPHLTMKILKEKSPFICGVFEYSAKGNIKFQCLHGLGHALMFFTDYNLTESLKLCDLQPSGWDQSSCYGGVFMENVFAQNKSQRYLTSDPHFPCNAIEEKYRRDCYVMQTSRMYELGLSYEEIGKECENAGNYRRQCMQSLGRDVSSDARKDPTSATICTNLPTQKDIEFCVDGITYALADNSWDGRYAFPYCDTLSDEHKEYCYTTVIKYLKNSLYFPTAEIAESCEKYSSYDKCKLIVNS